MNVMKTARQARAPRAFAPTLAMARTVGAA